MVASLGAAAAVSFWTLPQQPAVTWIAPTSKRRRMLITLRKSEAHYSPTTMYRDYAISPTLFHCESQSTTSVDSKTGQRYLTGASNVLLFSRDTKDNAYGTGAPYLFLGPAQYVSHTGDRPIAITWRLAHAMPTDVFTGASVVPGDIAHRGADARNRPPCGLYQHLRCGSAA